MTERLACIASMAAEGRQSIRVMQLEECQDDLHDQCLETRDSILMPGQRLYVCDCTCHD